MPRVKKASLRESAAPALPGGTTRTTLTMVAERAGVSPSTVSRILNGTAQVSVHKQQLVRSVIEELNFRPDPAARSLAGGRAMSIGVLTQFIDSPYYGEALRGIGIDIPPIYGTFGIALASACSHYPVVFLVLRGGLSRVNPSLEEAAASLGRGRLAVIRTITLPLGVRLDLGGIGKGLAADLVATGLRERGAEGALVDIGGDVRVTGTSPRGGAWTIAIEDPRNEHLLALVHVDDGGVATSTTLRRRWIHAGARRHHLVAPTTGESTTSDVVGASVVAATAGWADALSKVAFVDPAHVVDTLGPASALIMTSDGASTVVGPDVFERVEP